jgi:tripartite-type tricarboxylate transporter receptor subunit TctC
MFNRKRGFALLIAFLFLPIIFVACSDNQNKKSKVYPQKPINVIVSYNVGGGTDIGARVLLPFVEKELGIPLNVINKPGDGGWTGWDNFLNKPADGYTLAYVNTPNLMTGFLGPGNKRKANLDSFSLIINHVLDYGAIAVQPSEKRFKDVVELMDYARKYEVTASTTGVGSDDHIFILKLNKKFGTKFVPVHNSGAADGKLAVLKGYIDVYLANIGEITKPHFDSELKALAVLAPERSEFLPEVPTLSEAGYPGVFSWSARGIAAKKGTNPEILSKLVTAYEKAINNPDHLKKMSELGIKVKVLKGEDYYNFMKEEEKNCLDVAELLGWK